MNKNLRNDLLIIAASIVVAFIIAKTGVFIKILSASLGLKFFGSFVAGIFITSIFTAAPSAATFSEIALLNPAITTALFGAFGAVVGDFIIFKFMKDRCGKHVSELLKKKGGAKRLKMLLKLRYLRWITFFIGALCIASPLPDEIGISLLGFSRMKGIAFVLLSFAFHFAGIFTISILSQTFLG